MGEIDVYGEKSNFFFLQQMQEHKYLAMIKLPFESPFMNQ